MKHKIVFNEVKAKVGIEDVALALGYRVNPRAGIGKHIEMVLGKNDKSRDVIIINNTPDKSKQTFFRRNYQKGDVVTLIEENINSFNVPGNEKWHKIANVLAQFANQPVIDYAEKERVVKAQSEKNVFSSERYDVRQLIPESPHWLLTKRGFSNECIRRFIDDVFMIQDKNNTKYIGYNIGFPYKNPDSDKISGYEIRGGNGFKSKASGTDSANSFWSAEFPKGDPLGIKSVYLFESSFDAMAFYQMNNTRISLSEFALVSFGGSFTASQIEGVMRKYPSARLYDCFDNDLTGNIYSTNLVKISERKDIDINYTFNEDGSRNVVLKSGEKSVTIPENEFSFKEAAKKIGFKYNAGHWKAPFGYKDWNDCLLGNKLSVVNSLTKSKYDREYNLFQRRKNALKL